ncbi:SigE family RNA polymerase sigma factor [Nocardioidaceae bacterium]|nr:SigE family RNA polymerase sigma factor [Nocardioidaceae bacterium]
MNADEAITDLYSAHHTEMVRLAVLLVRDQLLAEDVVQDAFITLHRRWDRLDDPAGAVGYLHRSVVNGCRSAQRRRVVATRWIQRQDPRESLAPGADDAVLASERRDRVLDALADLPRRQREVLTLRYYRDMSEEEIASVLEISRGSVKTHASRGAAALRARLGGES